MSPTKFLYYFEQNFGALLYLFKIGPLDNGMSARSAWAKNNGWNARRGEKRRIHPAGSAGHCRFTPEHSTCLVTHKLDDIFVFMYLKRITYKYRVQSGFESRVRRGDAIKNALYFCLYTFLCFTRDGAPLDT